MSTNPVNDPSLAEEHRKGEVILEKVKTLLRSDCDNVEQLATSLNEMLDRGGVCVGLQAERNLWGHGDAIVQILCERGIITIMIEKGDPESVSFLGWDEITEVRERGLVVRNKHMHLSILGRNAEELARELMEAAHEKMIT